MPGTNWKLNLYLFCILIVLGAYYLTSNLPISLSNIDVLSKWSSFLANLSSIVALFTAGLWSYYLFIKGRILKPKVKLRIHLSEYSPSHSTAIIHFTVTNIGKVHLKALNGEASFYRMDPGNRVMEVHPFYRKENLFDQYQEPNNLLILESGDEINIDAVVAVDAGSLIVVKALFGEGKMCQYQENSIFKCEVSRSIQ